MALSHRGRKALNSIGIEDDVLESAIPMKGRLLHSAKGELKRVVYDPTFNQVGIALENETSSSFLCILYHSKMSKITIFKPSSRELIILYMRIKLVNDLMNKINAYIRKKNNL